MSPSKFLPPVLIAVVIIFIAVLSMWLGEAWLVPSLGSAVFTQALSPEQESALPYSIGIGQLVGAAAGMIGVFVAGAGNVPAFMGDHLVWARVLAAGIAVLLGAVVQILLNAKTPAGGATALVVALGAETASWAGAGRLVVGITLVTVLGEAVRQVMLRAKLDFGTPSRRL